MSFSLTLTFSEHKFHVYFLFMLTENCFSQINRRLLNFTYKMFNPADGTWGSVGEDFSMSGLAGHVAYGYRGTDLAICDIYNTYGWNKIFQPTTDFDRDIVQVNSYVFLSK